MTEVTIEDIQSYMRGRARHPIMTVKDSNDPDYMTMRDFVLKVKPNAEDYMHSITSGMNSILSSLRHMEPNDYNRIVSIFSNYLPFWYINGFNKPIYIYYGNNFSIIK